MGLRARGGKEDRVPKDAPGGFVKNVADILVVIILAIITASVLNSAIFEAEYVRQYSMYPTLYGGGDPSVPCDTAFDAFFFGAMRESGYGDKVLVLKTRNVKNGDIVIVRRKSRDGSSPGIKLVKRVIASGGDVVDVRDGRVLLNGEPLDEPYVTGSTYPCGFPFPYTVPADAFFLMGDNREHSGDSREFGAVDRKDVVGRVVLVVQKKTKKLVSAKNLA